MRLKLEELGVANSSIDYCDTVGGMAELYGRLLLGLNSDQANQIFYETSPESLMEFLEMVQEVTGVDLALSDPVTPMVTVDESGLIPVQSTKSVSDHSGGTGLPEMQEKPAES